MTFQHDRRLSTGTCTAMLSLKRHLQSKGKISSYLKYHMVFGYL